MKIIVIGKNVNGNMKKKIIISLIIVIVILRIGTIIGLNYKNKFDERNKLHYEQMKENIQPEVDRYVRVKHYYCNPERGENSNTAIYNGERLVNHGGMDKELLLDVDGESYCDVKVEVKCVGINQFQWDTYLKCKYFEGNIDSKLEEQG